MNETRLSWYLYQFLYFIKSRCLGIRKPLLAGIKITHQCNLVCKHCPFREKKGKSLSFSMIKESFKKLYELGVRLIIIEGGEPLLWRDNGYTIHDVVKEAKKLFYCTGITTNGTFPLDVDADIIWVSIDGLEKTHNYIRGKSFHKIINHIKESSHPDIYANITINRLNVSEVPGLVKFLKGIVKGITIQFHYPYGYYPYGDKEADKELYLPMSERTGVLDNLINLKKQGFPVSDSFTCLRALKHNNWKCRPWMIASVDPDGRLTHGCYVKNRGEIACEKCGFAAHAEISLAYNGFIESIRTGNRIFN